MSLINEALKKAQRQRAAETGGIAPASQEPLPSTPQTPIHRRRNPLAAQTVVLITIGCVLLLGGGVATAVLLFSSDSPPEVASAPRPTPATQPAPVAVPEPPALAPIVAVPPPEPPAPAAIPVTPQPPVAPTPAPSVTPPAPVAATPVVTPAPAPTPTLAPTPAPPPPTEGPPKADPRVYVFLDRIRVAGIRASDDDPRVLMNDRMYRLNDMVEPVLQLRLTGISSLALTFTGPNGFVYTRNF